MAKEKKIPGSRMDNHSYKRTKLRQVLEVLKAEIDEKGTEVLFQRQVEVEADPFRGKYTKDRLIQPIYSFNRLYAVYEEADTLQSCVEAMQQNIDGFGYRLNFLGKDVTKRSSKEAQAEYIKAKNFFDSANEKESWTTIRKRMREDLEVLGNGSFEIIRDRKRRISLVYYMPFRYVRLTPLDRDPITVVVKIPRDGKVLNVRVQKRFRRFAQLNQFENRVRWFKEFGDPRIMDAKTGDYKNKASDCDMVASEIMHFKLPFGGAIYGLPRWIGTMVDVLGRRQASFVNYDLFENQGIPPMAIMVSGGTLTDDSVDELEMMIRGMRGAEKWNRIALLESNPETVGIEEKGTAKIEIKNLSEFRKEDQMFDRYLKTTEQTIRHRFRLPPLYTGATETFTHATAKSARSVAEEQVFVPERSSFDEPVNNQIVQQELGITMWAYSSLGPKIVGPEEVSKGVETFAKAGGFSVNHAIERANESFGLQMSKYDEAWADYPINMVLKMLEMGSLSLEGIGPIDLPPPGTQQGGKPRGLPELPQKILKSDVFSTKEKRLYKQLLLIQQAIDSDEERDLEGESFEQ